MAQSGFTPILTYASNTPAAVPSAGNLTNSANGSELAVNTNDKRLFTKDGGGAVVELGINPSSLTTGVLSASADSSFTSTGALLISAGTTAERPAGTAGKLRFNTNTSKFEGYNGTGWTSVGGGATGSGNDEAFVENDLDVTQSFTVGQGGQATCTISIASPAVITQDNSFVAGQRIFFRTTGALPTGIIADQGYYVSATGLTTSSFQISATSGGVSIDTSGTQSGVQSCGKLRSAESVGVVTIFSGVTVTVPSGSRWVVL
jgi:hypothetical protein